MKLVNIIANRVVVSDSLGDSLLGILDKCNIEYEEWYLHDKLFHLSDDNVELIRTNKEEIDNKIGFVDDDTFAEIPIHSDRLNFGVLKGRFKHRCKVVLIYSTLEGYEDTMYEGSHYLLEVNLLDVEEPEYYLLKFKTD